MTEPTQSSMTWLIFALLTVVFWGVYGVFLHTGQMSMSDPANGRYKAFLFVGLAYVLTAVIAPAVVLAVNGASDRKSTRLNSSHTDISRMPSSA